MNQRECAKLALQLRDAISELSFVGKPTKEMTIEDVAIQLDTFEMYADIYRELNRKVFELERRAREP